jgi:Fe-S-cluster containining protein
VAAPATVWAREGGRVARRGSRSTPEPDSRTDPVDAGDAGAWLDEVAVALAGRGAADVPCGSCTACCTASQFVLIEPDEVDALAHIPDGLAVAAPGLPPGYRVLGYDQHGRCPMLLAGECSIYEHRPRTCRTYDCRVFAATGIEPEAAKVEIRRRVERWRFRVGSNTDHDRLAAVRAAAAAVQSPPAELDVDLPANPTQLAALAVEIHEVFLDDPPPGPAEVAAAIERVVAGKRIG